ncbi:DUF3311 domain-containing protein [Saccharopolyspora rosea]|uniref:DUF3311 domain-containing protein n=1 Tax=Saccharopolyspora rosea TaxID=524884 RepID=A0ABW3FLU3_9PSEU|nr:DUF3311 domain-containing protein [Saccharopolyspora rosea]
MSEHDGEGRVPARGRGKVLRFVLACLPWVGMLGCAPLADRVRPFVLGMPFLLFWVLAWVVLTSVCMAVVYWSDPANREERR